MNKKLTIALIVLSAVLSASAARYQPTRPDNIWLKFEKLTGDWVAEGPGGRAPDPGGFSLHPDLDGQILVRKNTSTSSGTDDRQVVHEDLMIIYTENEGKTFKAIYFDNEGHTINYNISFDSKDGSIVFTSEAMAKAPQFKLIYTFSDKDIVKVNFEIAPADKPGSFASYQEGICHRK